MSDARRHDIDWLRVLATYLLFVFHAGKVFDPAPFYHVRNAELSLAFLVLCGFLSLWHMPLFFLLAGWSAHGSLTTRGVRGFVAERLLKLALPLLAGCVLFGPIIKYVELAGGQDLSHRGLAVSPALQAGFRSVIPEGLATAPPFAESFLAFWPTYFTHLDRFTWSHLWFLAYLLAFSLLYLPLLVRLRGSRGRWAEVGAGWVYAPVLPLALIQIFLRPRWPGVQNLYDDWANFAYFTTYLLAGFLLARQPALEEAVRREWRRALAVGLGAAGVLLLAVLGVVRTPAIVLAGSAVAGWCFVVAIVGAAGRFLHFTSGAHRYLVESAFPVYVLHQVAIVLAGALVVRLSSDIAPKYALLLAAAIALTLAVYHLLVRPFALPRLLLGMKPRTGRARPAPAVAALLMAGLLLGREAAGATPLGRWYAEGGAAQVEITACGHSLCGRVVWLRAPFDEYGCVVRDRRNPEPALRARELLGLEILRGLEPAGGAWANGTVYDPGSGRTYRCTLRLAGDDRLELRGYVGVPLLGRTTTWVRVGAEERVCRRDGGAP